MNEWWNQIFHFHFHIFVCIAAGNKQHEEQKNKLRIQHSILMHICSFIYQEKRRNCYLYLCVLIFFVLHIYTLTAIHHDLITTRKIVCKLGH